MAFRQSVLPKLVAVLAVASAAPLLAAAPTAAQEGTFADIAVEGLYAAPVAALAEAGVFDGTECGSSRFCPSESLDRETMAVWTMRVLGGEDPPAVSATNFSDVDPDSFYAPFIERMAELGVTAGCDDGSRFCPGRTVTRAQMAVFLTRAFSLEPGPDPGFSDVPADAWYFDQMTALAASGITKGCDDGTGFCPGRDTTRAQMATFLWRASIRKAGGSAPYVGLPGVKHVVYERDAQRVWLIKADGSVLDNYPVSGRDGTPKSGQYKVFSKSVDAWSFEPGVTMKHMVRFARGRSGAAIGFHAIPRRGDVPIQTEQQLGQFRSAGCVRQRDDKAQQLYEWAPIGTPVVVLD